MQISRSPFKLSKTQLIFPCSLANLLRITLKSGITAFLQRTWLNRHGWNMRSHWIKSEKHEIRHRTDNFQGYFTFGSELEKAGRGSHDILPFLLKCVAFSIFVCSSDTQAGKQTLFLQRNHLQDKLSRSQNDLFHYSNFWVVSETGVLKLCLYRMSRTNKGNQDGLSFADKFYLSDSSSSRL